MVRHKQHQLTALDEGLQGPPRRAKSSQKLTPQLSHKPSNENFEGQNKKKYYMRKGLFSNLNENLKRKSIAKTERVSQNSQTISSRKIAKNSSQNNRMVRIPSSQEASSIAQIKKVQPLAGLISNSILR